MRTVAHRRARLTVVQDDVVRRDGHYVLRVEPHRSTATVGPFCVSERPHGSSRKQPRMAQLNRINDGVQRFHVSSVHLHVSALRDLKLYHGHRTLLEVTGDVRDTPHVLATDKYGRVKASGGEPKIHCRVGSRGTRGAPHVRATKARDHTGRSEEEVARSPY